MSLALCPKVEYIVSMKDINDIIDLTFIVAISAGLIVRLITL